MQREGWITTDGVLAPKHDAAHKHWGGDWRMPTEQEFDDLNTKCDWTWTTMNGVNGCVVRGKGDYSSKSIFLPCAGLVNGTSLYYASSGKYWSSVPDSVDYEDCYPSWYLSFSSYGNGMGSNTRRDNGQPVRPLLDFTK